MAGKKTAIGAETSTAMLKAFHDGKPVDLLTISRFDWDGGDGGDLAPLWPAFDKKLCPFLSGGRRAAAAAVDVLLPPDAPQDYTDAEYLVDRSMRGRPAGETLAYVQLTMRFPDATNLHHPYEAVREWTADYFVRERRLPVVLVLHNPRLAGSDNPGHCHALVLPRRLTRLGFAGIERTLGKDRSRREMRQAWSEFAAKAGLGIV